MDNFSIPKKRCSKCRQEFPATAQYFNRDRTHKDGFSCACKICTRARAKRFYEKNASKVLAASARYQKANTEKVREYKKLHYEANKERYAKNAKEYVDRNRESVNKRHRHWRKSNPDKALEYGRRWSKANPELRRQAKQRHCARRASLPATFTTADWQYCLDYFDNRCAYCGKPKGLWHTLAQEHFVPESKGGGYTRDNIIPACHGTHGCNNRKGNNDPLQWIVNHFGKRKAKEITSRILNYFTSFK